MAIMLPWTSIEIGDLEVSAPATPCLLVHTSYVDGEPESSVTYFWQDEATGLIDHEVLFLKPVGFEEAVAWAQEQATARDVERIHVHHAAAAKRRPKKAMQPRAAATSGRKMKRAKAKKIPRKKAKKVVRKKKAAKRARGR